MFIRYGLDMTISVAPGLFSVEFCLCKHFFFYILVISFELIVSTIMTAKSQLHFLIDQKMDNILSVLYIPVIPPTTTYIIHNIYYMYELV